jgi:hypothetical protein
MNLQAGAKIVIMKSSSVSLRMPKPLWGIGFDMQQVWFVVWDENVHHPMNNTILDEIIPLDRLRYLL